jgi:hypothetical protein
MSRPPLRRQCRGRARQPAQVSCAPPNAAGFPLPPNSDGTEPFEARFTTDGMTKGHFHHAACTSRSRDPRHGAVAVAME